MIARTVDPDGDIVDEATLSFSGDTSIFEGTVRHFGATKLLVIASQPGEANFGKIEMNL